MLGDYLLWLWSLPRWANDLMLLAHLFVLMVIGLGLCYLVRPRRR